MPWSEAATDQSLTPGSTLYLVTTKFDCGHALIGTKKRSYVAFLQRRCIPSVLLLYTHCGASERSERSVQCFRKRTAEEQYISMLPKGKIPAAGKLNRATTRTVTHPAEGRQTWSGLLGHCKFRRHERGAAVNSSCTLVLPFYRSDDCGLALHQRKREKPVGAQLGRALARVRGGSI
jgi:hypothetical protein